MIRRSCSLLLGLLILFSVDVFQAGAAPPLPRPGSVDIVLLVDNSPSTKETDPSNLRIEAAQFLLDYLEGTSSVSGINVRAGVASFGGGLGKQVVLSPIWGGAVRDAIVSEEIPYTDFRPPLAAAVEQFRLRRSFDLTAATAVVLFTDGNPELGPSKLSEADTQRYFRGEPFLGDPSQLRLNTILQTLKDAGTTVLVISVSDRDRAIWEEALAGFGRFVFIQDIGDLPGLYHDFAAQLMGSLPGQSQQLSAGQPYSIVLQPHLEQVTFTILKDAPETTVTVQAIASGAEPAPTAGGAGRLHAIYAVPAPEGGRWEVKTSGDAQLWVDQRLPTLQVEGPSGPQVLGQQVELVARLVVGKRAVEDDKLTIVPIVTDPDGHTLGSDIQVFRRRERYEIVLGELAAAGTYTVALSAEVDNVGLFVVTEPTTVEVFSVPILKQMTLEETGDEGNGIVEIQIEHSDQLSAAVPIEAQMTAFSGERLSSCVLHDDGQPPDLTASDGKYSCAIPKDRLAKLGQLRVHVAGSTVHGLAFSADSVLNRERVLEVSSTAASGTSVPSVGREEPGTSQSGMPSHGAVEKASRVSITSPVFSLVHALSFLALAVGIVGLILAWRWLRSRFGFWWKNPPSTLHQVEVVLHRLRRWRLGKTTDLKRDWHGAFAVLMEKTNLTESRELDRPDMVRAYSEIGRAVRDDTTDFWRFQVKCAGPSSRSAALKRVATKEFKNRVANDGLESRIELMARAAEEGTLETYVDFWEDI